MLIDAFLKMNQSELNADSNNRTGMNTYKMICGCILPMMAVLSPRKPMLA